MNDLQISVTITEYGKQSTFTAPKGTLLKEILDREGISYNLPCGGNGRCGNCRVRFVEGAPDPSSEDRAQLTGKELLEGVRLLCRCTIDRDCLVELTAGTSDLELKAQTVETTGNLEGTGDYGIAVDLGTTTVAAALIKRTSTGYSVIRTASRANSQRSYGGDVISRIAAAEDEEVLARMSSLVAGDISRLIKELTAPDSIPLDGQESGLKAITIAGNTTMLHLLMGRDVRGLGVYPYTPETLEMEKLDSDFVFGCTRDARLTLLPGISGYVGADIVAGLYTLGLENREKFFFLDLGTNGEMAFYDGESLRVASAAAGPVFEAGGISCGVASVPGAICHVEIDKNSRQVSYRTIDDEEPCGLCGTGVIETVSELLDNGIIDETGLLSEEYFDEGFPLTEDGDIRFTQQDIRNLQLAKAAIFTGAKALLQENKPDRVYICGGFGSNIDAAKIANLKMFPESFDGKIVSAGNTALEGAILYTYRVLCGKEEEQDANRKIELIRDKAEVVQLAAMDGFDSEYIEAMNF